VPFKNFLKGRGVLNGAIKGKPLDESIVFVVVVVVVVVSSDDKSKARVC